MATNHPPFISDAHGSSGVSVKASGNSAPINPNRAQGGEGGPGRGSNSARADGDINPHRPQKTGSGKEVEPTLNDDSVPENMGGRILKADPSGQSGMSGTVSGVQGASHKPFRVK